MTLPFVSGVTGRRHASDTGGTVAGAKTALGLKPPDGLEVPGVDVDEGDVVGADVVELVPAAVDGGEVAGADVVELEPAAVRWLEHPHAMTAVTSTATATAKPECRPQQPTVAEYGWPTPWARAERLICARPVPCFKTVDGEPIDGSVLAPPGATRLAPAPCCSPRMSRSSCP